MSYSISTLLLRNLSDVLAKMTPSGVALQSTRSFTKTQYSMTPKAVYFVAVTRLIVLLVC
jgi:hypothetical protein